MCGNIGGWYVDEKEGREWIGSITLMNRRLGDLKMLGEYVKSRCIAYGRAGIEFKLYSLPLSGKQTCFSYFNLKV